MQTAEARSAASALETAAQAVRRAQEPLRLARRRFAALQTLADARAGDEPAEEASQDDWRIYCERAGEAAEALGLDRARQAVRSAEEAMLDAVEAAAAAGGVMGADVAELHRGRAMVRYRAAMLDVGMRLG